MGICERDKWVDENANKKLKYLIGKCVLNLIWSYRECKNVNENSFDMNRIISTLVKSKWIYNVLCTGTECASCTYMHICISAYLFEH